MKRIFVLTFFLFAILASIIAYQGSSEKTQSPLALPTPTPEISEVNSIYGTMKLIMTKKENNEIITYSFAVSDQAGKTTPIFSKNAGVGETMAPNHNSWSPNNKFVIIEDKIGSFTDYLIFKSDGENFADGQKYLNATALFNQKVKQYNLKEITGWDDPVLASVRTVNGPHFWFDLTNQSFIQLAR